MKVRSSTAIKTKSRIETKIRTLSAIQAKTRARIDCASKDQTDDFEDAMSLDEVTPQGVRGDEADDESYDCEIGFKDIDVDFEEGAAIGFGQDDLWLENEVSESAFIPSDYYEIRIVQRGPVDVDCIVQDDEWSSADGIPNHDELIVAHQQKMRWLKKIAKWLKDNHDKILALGPEAFVARCPLATQKDVYRDNKSERSSFSRYIRCIRIVWDRGSIPAWMLFKE